MATITWSVLGLLVASIAKLVIWDGDPIGWMPLLSAGIVGAIGGGFLRAVLLGPSNESGFDLASLLMAVGGATAAVYLYYLAIGRKRLMAARAIHAVEQRRAA
jgi:uncharacterized membrane protein YeaQ/YmgE (transglycosylase-associated protein family)